MNEPENSDNIKSQKPKEIERLKRIDGKVKKEEESSPTRLDVDFDKKTDYSLLINLL